MPESLDVENVPLRPRNSVRESTLVRRLRKVPDAERYELIQRLISRDIVVGLEVARAALTNRKHAENLLERGILGSDPSDVELWLRCLVPKVGVGRVVAFLRRELETYPDAVDNALYWLPRFLTAASEREKAQYRALHRLASAQGVIRGPKPIRDQSGGVRFRRVK
ncbi:MAG: hypothetical protein HS104_06480 [Polyangiaceae bacterium]|nr:hypothetical protein [Polyangiaceae bacterium]MCL4755895.1 hypothetical protein [Myxococcales bacterium]